jgi:1-acyl-sn-glycerol-3-phosphate acyltransferase
VPLVPAAVNSGYFWGRRSFLKRPGRIVLEFLDPIPPGWPRRRVMAELEQRIEAAAAGLLREAEALNVATSLVTTRAPRNTPAQT